MTSFAGLPLDYPRLMGIVNLTPDSFSDGGQYLETAAAIDHGHRLIKDGADIVDLGAESTRPGATDIPAALQIERLMPVIEALENQTVRISVDTRSAEVMDAALRAGAHITNDISALRHDPAAADVIRHHKPSVILMHMKGTPRTMQDDPRYENVVGEVLAFLRERAVAASALGLSSDQICLDPGIGFGKTLAHNLILLRHLTEFNALEFPVMAGISNKSFIGQISGAAVDNRLSGTIAATLFALRQGIMIHRVHDVAAARQAIQVWQALAESRLDSGAAGG